MTALIFMAGFAFACLLWAGLFVLLLRRVAADDAERWQAYREMHGRAVAAWGAGHQVRLRYDADADLEADADAEMGVSDAIAAR